MQKGRPTWIPRLYRRKTNGEIAEGESPALVFGRPLGRSGSRGMWPGFVLSDAAQARPGTTPRQI